MASRCGAPLSSPSRPPRLVSHEGGDGADVQHPPWRPPRFVSQEGGDDTDEECHAVDQPHHEETRQ
eukprot:CAMPEP_0177186760 /NCGR_PEP_ID=MMETSP0367-20130122/18825_1 /TAXON_ID=447022 ORGANISM="Scrippsiella hangoei-like, Strain SHHI-4" /NCGR_SAMPLE_ID=MMETSP0367 /ASSEMBLY_ACC=CAM_ASM_000362 /LENGTH=65 /DNA_ID=CAMNT_0018634089 /DNA_START=9 /DNA_END=203 /DNA_ORIENTATION=+